MVFYEVRVKIRECEELFEGESKRINDDIFKARTEEMYENTRKKCFIFLASVKRRADLTLGIISKSARDYEKYFSEYISELDIKLENVETKEITLMALNSLMRMAARNDYIHDDYEIMNAYCLNDLANRSRFHFNEYIVNTDNTEAKLLKRAENILCEETLTSELKRIFEGTMRPFVSGHPVHYLVTTDDRDVRSECVNILLTALHKRSRIENKRYSIVRLKTGMCLLDEEMEHLYKANEGGAIVIYCESNDHDNNERIRSGGEEILLKLCETMRKYRNKVLTIFCIKRAENKSEELITGSIGNCTIVKLSDDVVSGDKAKKYLKILAKNNGVAGSKELYTIVNDEEKGYLASDLRKEFDRWFDRYLKSNIYPQYKEFESADKNIAEKKPVGSAYTELQEMIGLSEVKNVIEQALNYYKAQRIFKEKGMESDRPAMHMVFTGNPGTAKTTVARLFARIMKENGLLSRGDLYEVGRADLVGKYVGWTAQIVKEKFKLAKGSVLFIDEAYSLVEERDGMYGDEAINTIVQEMENNREDMVVIFAGYSEEMEKFIERNPGLRSRIAFHVPFADYSADELYSISELTAKKKGISLGVDVKEKIMPILETARKRSDFGNGRYVRNMVEKARMKQADRLVKMDIDTVTREDVCTLVAADFELPVDKEIEERKIGFIV